MTGLSAAGLGVARCAAGAMALLSVVSAAAAPITSQPLTVAAANALGNSIYDLTLTSNGSTALLSGSSSLNSDGARHGIFDALVWVPNAKSNTLDLVAADLLNGQLVRYAGPDYGTSTVISSWSRNAGSPQPTTPVGLAVDAAGDLFVISPVGPSVAKPGLWVLPFNKSTGAYGAPLLIDDTFGGTHTLALAELLVAGSSATPDGAAAAAWNAGDLVVLVGDTSQARVIVYAQAAVASVIAGGGALGGPTSTAVAQSMFQGVDAVPTGMDSWPSDATHGVSLLFTTVDGRILRFDSSRGEFVGNFASGLGLGLEKIKVGTYASTPYAFVTQLSLLGGAILQFGAPPASGSNAPLATFRHGVLEPVGLAITSSGSAPASSCIGPPGCSPVGNQTNQQFSGPGTSNIPAGASVLQQICVVPADPRVAITNGTWSCLGPQINVCPPGQTTNCVPPTLDVSQFCPGFPTTVLPPYLCGHSGPTGTGLAVMEETAIAVDENANNIFIQTGLNADATVPGPYNLSCAQVPLTAWAPRSDLPTVEGVIPEDQSLANTFIDLTAYCEDPGSHSHSASMYAYGIALNSAASGLGSGPSGGLFGFVTNKFTYLSTTLDNAINESQVNPTVASTLQGYVSQSQAYFNSGYQNDAPGGYSCALNSLASTESYLQANANASNFFYVQPPAGNPNVAGDLDGRLGNLFLTINSDFLDQVPNTSWPTTNVPPCITLAASPATVVAGNAATLSWGAAAPTYPLSFPPAQCSLSASDGTFQLPSPEGPTGTAVSTGTLTIVGTYTASLECTGSSADTLPGLATTVVTVLPALTGITVSPATASATVGATAQFADTGSFANGTTGPITASYPPVVWSSNSAFASVTATGLATCTGPGTALISATSGTIAGSATLACNAAAPVIISVTPAAPAIGDFLNEQFTATGIYASGPTQNITSAVTWSAVPGNIATISASGLAFCEATGSATITATSGSVSGSTTLTCQPVVSSLSTFTAGGVTQIAVGGTVQITARAAYTDGSVADVNNTATWLSSNPSAAVVSNGLVTGVSAGTSNISASLGGSSSGMTTITVTGPTLQIISVTPNTSQSLGAGGTVQLTLTGGYSDSSTLNLTSVATWTSSNTAVATVSGGLVTAVGPGFTQIYGSVSGVSPVNVLVVVTAPAAATLNGPNDLKLAPNGDLYVANYGAGQVLVYAPNASGQYTSPPSALTTNLVNPVRLAFGPSGTNVAGELFVADVGSNSVEVFNSAGDLVTNAVISGLTRPLGVTVDGNGYVYVAENQGSINDIKVFAYNSGPGNAATLLTTQTQDASTPTPLPFTSVGALAYNGFDILVGIGSPSAIGFYTPAQMAGSTPPVPAQAPITSGLNGPVGLAFDASLNLYVSNYYANTVTQYAAQSGATPTYSTTPTAFSLTLPSGMTPALQTPQGVAVDASGNVYVDNTPNNFIYVYNAAGAYQYTVGVTASLSATNPVPPDGAATLTWSVTGLPAGTMCSMTSSDGTYQGQSVGVSGTENTNAVTTPGYYQATLSCPGSGPTVATFLVQ
ncbi:MAG TPA: Ig-like domain-containing protein [Steroidobacteraceae bacterium]|nr:Ig-like domain-containing protein [Steroidobacteraceae bacterium]